MEIKLSVHQAAKEVGIASSTLKRWIRNKLFPKEKVWSAKFGMNVYLFNGKEILYLKWLKKMSGADKGSEFYLRLLFQYIREGRIPKESLGWPLPSEAKGGK